MIIALNNKSNLDKEEFTSYIEKLSNIKTNNKIILCPTYLNIPISSNYNISIASQNVSKNENGAYTGEVSAKILKSYNVEYSLVGHSERRKYQKETDEEIKEKVERLLENDIIPILCIGETKEENQEGISKQIVEKELSQIPYDDRIIIAYEPVYSIGTGIVPSNDEINDMINYIKSLRPNNKVLYGGSVNEENVDILNNIKIVDGYLLGGISLKLDKLEKLLEKCS